MHPLIATLHQRGLLADVDVYFADLMLRLSKTTEETAADQVHARHYLALGAALASHAIAQGDTCVRLRAWARRIIAFSRTEEGFSTAPIVVKEWLGALRNSRVVGQYAAYCPLILGDRGQLYLQRYWQYEHDVAEDLLDRARKPMVIWDEARLRDDLQQLAPSAPPTGIHWQKIAMAVAALKQLCVISGGPGTGKTSTVLRILALLSGQSEHPLRIGLAAPTGKAAARLQESIRAAKSALPLPAERLAQIPEEASTLHRLLGARPNSNAFRHNREFPLPLDVLVIDEVSMVGLSLMAKTLAALPETARLILLGDKDQLVSVEAGVVFKEICAQSGHYSPAFSERLATFTGQHIPFGNAELPALADCVVLLTHSYRFGGHSGIGTLAHLINRGRSGDALALLESRRFSDIDWGILRDPDHMSKQFAEPFRAGFADYLTSIRQNATPEVIFNRFNQFRILTALRDGPFGVQHINRLCEQILQRSGWPMHAAWYVGRPVLITQNDYGLQLFNGDVGITLPDPIDPERLKVFFVGNDNTLRSFAPARLPTHETVYAMTIHKSQGSEFDHVLVVLPNQRVRVLNRQLLYTALTRAKLRASFYGTPEVLADGIRQRSRRASGLRDQFRHQEKKSSGQL